MTKGSYVIKKRKKNAAAHVSQTGSFLLRNETKYYDEQSAQLKKTNGGIIMSITFSPSGKPVKCALD